MYALDSSSPLPLFLRYRMDGIIFKSSSSNVEWGAHELKEVEKQDIQKRVVIFDETVPEDTYEPREEVRILYIQPYFQ